MRSSLLWDVTQYRFVVGYRRFRTNYRSPVQGSALTLKMGLINFTFVWPCIVTNFFIIKPTRYTNLPNLLRHETLHVSGSSFAHHQKFIHCTLGTGVCHTGMKAAFKQDQDGTGFILLLVVIAIPTSNSVPSYSW